MISVNRNPVFIQGVLLIVLVGGYCAGALTPAPAPLPGGLPAMVVSGTTSPDVADTYIPLGEYTSAYHNLIPAGAVYYRSLRQHDDGTGTNRFWYLIFDNGQWGIRSVIKTNSGPRWYRRGSLVGEYPASTGATGSLMVTTGTAMAPTHVVVCDGNSLGDSRSSSYPVTLENALGSPWVVYNPSFSGNTTANNLDRAPGHVDLHYRASQLQSIVVIWEICNSLFFGATRDTTYQQYKKYCLARKALGWKVIAVTVTPHYNYLLSPTFNEDVAYINADMRLHYRDYADELADVAASPLLDDASDKTYYADGVHMTDAGYAVVAGIVEAAVKRVAGSGNK